MSKRIGLVASAFDLLHPGHIMILKDARSRCDFLIAALHTDPTIERPTKNKPVQSVAERYIQLDGCKYVDEIIPYDTEQDLKSIMIYHNVDITVLGHEYEYVDYTGQDLGVEACFHKRIHNYSSTELRTRLLNSINKK